MYIQELVHNIIILLSVYPHISLLSLYCIQEFVRVTAPSIHFISSILSYGFHLSLALLVHTPAIEEEQAAVLASNSEDKNKAEEIH